jgi:hypothetical protein
VVLGRKEEMEMDVALRLMLILTGRFGVSMLWSLVFIFRSFTPRILS